MVRITNETRTNVRPAKCPRRIHVELENSNTSAILHQSCYWPNDTQLYGSLTVLIFVKRAWIRFNNTGVLGIGVIKLADQAAFQSSVLTQTSRICPKYLP